eukprot:5988071-Amphidinium_carterae.1
MTLHNGYMTKLRSEFGNLFGTNGNGKRGLGPQRGGSAWTVSVGGVRSWTVSVGGVLGLKLRPHR